ncbi:MAG: SurA N-terminal domain-containing protein [Saprospiraceae bacterium]|nr:SurA N-terminal domain-containing protein [Saprospiraceae bacterium]
MALLGTIRNRFGWLMMAIIVIAIGAFLFMDVQSAGQGGMGPGGQQEVVIGTVNGVKITQDEFQTYTDFAMNNMQRNARPGFPVLQEAAREVAWNQLVEKYLVEQKAAQAGLAVTPEEMASLFLGDEPYVSMSVKGSREFINPETGEFNKQMVKEKVEKFQDNSAKDYEGQERADFIEDRDRWRTFREAVKYERLSSKYTNMLTAGSFAPDWMVNVEYTRDNERFNFKYVQIPYASDEVGEVEVTDAEIEAYITEHKNEYAATQSRASIEYITFDIKASAADSATYKEYLTKKAADFRTKTTFTQDSLFVNRGGYMDIAYFTKAELDDPLNVKDSLFSVDKGTVIDPYINNGSYKITKLIDRKVIADSVRVRHIMRRVQTDSEYQAARVLLDSLKKGLNAGTLSFAEVAKNNGQDFTAPEGDLGYIGRNTGGQITKMFENYVFFEADKDSFTIIQNMNQQTQQFSLHLVQVTDYKNITNTEGVRVASFEKAIVPSSKTIKAVETEASTFISENRQLAQFRAKSEELGKTINKASNLTENGFRVDGLLPTSGTAKIVTWANRSDNIGELSSVPYAIPSPNGNYTSQYVVAALISKTPKGSTNAKDPQVIESVRLILTNKKKAEKIKADLADSRDLEAIAGKYSVNVETTTNPISYSSMSVGALGFEPKLQAVASLLEPNQVSNPIEGTQGVYLIEVILKTPSPAPGDLGKARSQVEEKFKRSFNNAWKRSAIDNSNIKDNRSSLY